MQISQDSITLLHYMSRCSWINFYNNILDCCIDLLMKWNEGFEKRYETFLQLNSEWIFDWLCSDMLLLWPLTSSPTILLQTGKRAQQGMDFCSSFGCVSLGNAIWECVCQNNPFFNDCIWETMKGANMVSYHIHGATKHNNSISGPIAPQWNTGSISFLCSISRITHAWPHQ